MKQKLSPEEIEAAKAAKRERFLAIRQSGKPKGVPTKALSKVSHLQLSTWETFTDFINNEGLELFKQNLMQLDPKSYIIAYLQLLEFIKPKLTRATVVEEKTIQVNDVTFE